MTGREAAEMMSKSPDYATKDLHDHLAMGNTATWTWYVQVMSEAEGENYKFDIFDVTKIWSHSDYPLIPVGKMILNRNPDNFFAEVE